MSDQIVLWQVVVCLVKCDESYITVTKRTYLSCTMISMSLKVNFSKILHIRRAFDALRPTVCYANIKVKFSCFSELSLCLVI